MRFLDRAEAAKTVRKLERQSGKTSPQFTLFYTSGATDYRAAASVIIDDLGAFNRATLIRTIYPVRIAGYHRCGRAHRPAPANTNQRRFTLLCNRPRSPVAPRRPSPLSVIASNGRRGLV